MQKKHQPGVCPVCGSIELEYGEFEFDDDGGYYPTECLTCHSTFNEAYNFVFDDHYEIKKAKATRK